MNQEEFEKFIKQYPEAIHIMQWVKGSKGRRGYWRVKPYTYLDPTVNQLKTMIAFAETAYQSFGTKGLRIRDNKLLNSTATMIHDALKGKKFKKTPTFEETMRKVRRALKIMAKQYEKKKVKAVAT